MKYISLLAFFVLGLTLVSCSSDDSETTESAQTTNSNQSAQSSTSFKSAEDAELVKSDTKLTINQDSLSYVIGIEYAKSIYADDNFKKFLDKQKAIQGFESNINDVYPESCEKSISKLKGVNKQDFNKTYISQGSECIGRIVAYTFFKEMKAVNKLSSFNFSQVKSGFADFILGKKLAIDEEKRNTILEEFSAIMNAEMEAESNQIKAENEKLGKLMMDNARKLKGAKVFPNGIVIQELKAGSGASPGPNDDVQIEYVLINAKGKTIQNSYDMKKNSPNQAPVVLNLSQVIPGWTFGLQKMKKGGKYKLFIPAKLAYGDQAPAEIGPGASLQFIIDLVNVGKSGTLMKPMPQGPANIGGGF
jgi:FKBP-type peptidyl-prolyl cis-trans isomerase